MRDWGKCSSFSSGQARSRSGFYVALLFGGLVMTVGTRLVAAVGVKLGFWTVYGAPADAPVSALRLPQR